MRVQVVGAGVGPGFALSTFVLDGVLAVDAGALGWFAPPDRQAAVRDVLLTHSHLDHFAGLASFVENVYGTAEPPTVHATAPTLRALGDHVFNDVIVPDFVRLSAPSAEFLRLTEFAPGRAFEVGRYRVTAFDVDHTVPTVGLVIDDGSAAVAVVTDTAPVPAVLAERARTPRLRAVFLEASFPSGMERLAEVTKHHTAGQFVAAARELPAAVRVFAVHVKPRYVEAITAEVRAAELPNVTVAEPGQVVEV